MDYLIVGLGNPGTGYHNTRHNVGFQVVQEFAKRHGMEFRHSLRLIGEVAQGEVGGKRCVLLLPTTYMNSSGDAVRRCLDAYQIPLDHLLVVSDDVALELGAMRIRPKGSDGGHNGLKSIASHLGTEFYARLRIGVGSPGEGDLADYVLGRFTAEEMSAVSAVVERAQEVLEIWILQGVAQAMQLSSKTNNKKLEIEET